MPSRKRTRPMRASRRPLKRARRSFNTSVPRGFKSPTVSVKRTFYGGVWTFGTTSVNDWWRFNSYTFSNLPNVAEYTNLFDEYKINAIKVHYRPSYDTVEALTSDVNPGTSNSKVIVHTLVDPASTVLPSGTYTSATLNAFLENGDVKTRDGNKAFTVFYKPKMFQGVNGAGTAARLVNPSWLRTSDPAAIHYGHHVYIQSANNTTPMKYDFFITYYFQVRGMK